MLIRRSKQKNQDQDEKGRCIVGLELKELSLSTLNSFL